MIADMAAKQALESATEALITKFMGMAAAADYLAGKTDSATQSIAASASRYNSYMANTRPERSYAVGTDYVPHDMIARVHKGEAIIPASENKRNQPTNITIPVSVGGRHLETIVLTMVDGHIVERNARGLTTERVY